MGCVLVHGFTGTPDDLAMLGQTLADAGFSVELPLLTGHDRGARGVAEASLEDWRRDVHSAVDYLERKTKRPVMLVGFSMGGLLVMDNAIRGQSAIAGLATLAAPLELGPSARWASDLARGVPAAIGRSLAWPKFGGSDISTGQHVPGPSAMPLTGIGELLDLIDHVHGHIEEIEVPTLIMHAIQDHTAPRASAIELTKRLKAPWTRLVTLDTGFHLVPRDVCRDQVNEEVLRFAEMLQEKTRPPA